MHVRFGVLQPKSMLAFRGKFSLGCRRLSVPLSGSIPRLENLKLLKFVPMMQEKHPARFRICSGWSEMSAAGPPIKRCPVTACGTRSWPCQRGGTRWRDCPVMGASVGRVGSRPVLLSDVHKSPSSVGTPAWCFYVAATRASAKSLTCTWSRMQVPLLQRRRRRPDGELGELHVPETHPSRWSCWPRWGASHR
jgi:hypothetical protein